MTKTMYSIQVVLGESKNHWSFHNTTGYWYGSFEEPRAEPRKPRDHTSYFRNAKEAKEWDPVKKPHWNSNFYYVISKEKHIRHKPIHILSPYTDEKTLCGRKASKFPNAVHPENYHWGSIDYGQPNPHCQPCVHAARMRGYAKTWWWD